MCNNASACAHAHSRLCPPHRLAKLSIALGGSAVSQWRHVALPVTSSATPLTKEGNKHPSRRNGRRREEEREVGGRGRENQPHLDPSDTKDTDTQTHIERVTDQDPKPETFFLLPGQTATFPPRRLARNFIVF